MDSLRITAFGLNKVLIQEQPEQLIKDGSIHWVEDSLKKNQNQNWAQRILELQLVNKIVMTEGGQNGEKINDLNDQIGWIWRIQL